MPTYKGLVTIFYVFVLIYSMYIDNFNFFVIHAVSFIRDTVILRLVLSLNFIKILTSFVPYLSLISRAIIDSEYLH